MQKFKCINTQHAHIASFRLLGLGRKAILDGRTILTDSKCDKYFIRVLNDAMGCELPTTDEDRKALENYNVE